MASASKAKFEQSKIGARVFQHFAGVNNAGCTDQAFVDQVCLGAGVASVVGCWEGYIEAVLREFIAKVRVQSHRRTWTLIAQYESLVDKLMSDLNTPSWDKVRDLILIVTGMDPYPAWVWAPKFSNQNDTKAFFEGVMLVRHSFAHGFPVPRNIPALAPSGLLSTVYLSDVCECIEFLVDQTDNLLEHELKHRHQCPYGWA